MQKPDDVLAGMSDEALTARLAALGFVPERPIDMEDFRKRMKCIPPAVIRDSTGASGDTDLRPK